MAANEAVVEQSIQIQVNKQMSPFPLMKTRKHKKKSLVDVKLDDESREMVWTVQYMPFEL